MSNSSTDGSMIARCPEPAIGGATLEMHGNMAVVQNMSGIIATEVGRGLGAAMQQAKKGGTPHSGSTSAGEDAKPYTQYQLATLLGFHGAMNVQLVKKVWRLFKMSKTLNYDHMCRAIKGDML